VNLSGNMYCNAVNINIMNMSAKPGTPPTRPPTFLPGGTLMLLSPQLLNDKSQSSMSLSSVPLFFLRSEVSDNKLKVDRGGGNAPPTFLAREDTNALLLPTFAIHKVSILSSSLVLFFLPPEVNDNKHGVDGRITPK